MTTDTHPQAGYPHARMCPFRQVEPGWPGSPYPRATCTVHPRPADTFLRFPEERAWFAYHVDPEVPTAGYPDDRGGHVGSNYDADLLADAIWAEARRQAPQDAQAAKWLARAEALDDRRRDDEEHSLMVAGWRQLRAHADDDILAWLRTASA